MVARGEGRRVLDPGVRRCEVQGLEWGGEWVRADTLAGGGLSVGARLPGAHPPPPPLATCSMLAHMAIHAPRQNYQLDGPFKGGEQGGAINSLHIMTQSMISKLFCIIIG